MTAAVDRARDGANRLRAKVAAAAVIVGLVVSVGIGVALVLRPTAGSLIPPLVPAPMDAQPIIIAEVLSGDTLVIRLDAPGPQWQEWSTLTVRLAGVEVGPNAGACHATISREHLATLLPTGSLAWATVGAEAPDADGRWPVFLWSTPAQFVNGLLAANGDVRPIVDEVPTQYVAAINQGAEQAYRRGAGLWGDCR